MSPALLVFEFSQLFATEDDSRCLPTVQQRKSLEMGEAGMRIRTLRVTIRAASH